MTFRARIAAGLFAAVLAGLLGQTLAAVAFWSGSGNRSISGVVTGQRGRPVAGSCVEAHASHLRAHEPEVESRADDTLVASAVTRADGSYTLGRLLPHGYKLWFGDCDAEVLSTHLITSEWWRNAATFEIAEEIIVPADRDVTGIDAVVASL